MTMIEEKVGFIGAGMMASALIQGFMQAGILKHKPFASDIDKDAKNRIEKLGGVFEETNEKVVEQSDIIFLAVKPYVVVPLLTELSHFITNDKVIVSIAAGITISQIEDTLRAGARVIRVMPNTPCLVHEMAAAYSKGVSARTGDMETVGKLLNTVGTAIECEEKHLDAVTGLSGSGPAYIYILIEALADAGVRQGLARNLSMKLAAQTVKGAAQMVLQNDSHPAVLKDQVCSPGGTTIAGVEALETNGFRAAAMSAVSAATKRARELSSNM